MDQLQKQFCRRLRQARTQSALKQEQVARYLKVPTSAVSAFEAGNRKLDSIELYQISKLYNLSIDWFFEQENESSKSNNTGFSNNVIDDPLMLECIKLMQKAPEALRRSAAYGVIGFLSQR